MKLTIIIAFVVVVFSLSVSVILGLQMIWSDQPQGPSPELGRLRLLGTSIVVMFAALIYIAVGEALHRILSIGGKSPPDR